jgi:hypothetical protein
MVFGWLWKENSPHRRRRGNRESPHASVSRTELRTWAWLIYPRELKVAPLDIASLRVQLEQCELHYAIITELEADQLLLPFAAPAAEAVAFEAGNVESLAASMRRSYEYLVKDAVLERAVQLLEHGIWA